MTNRYVWVAWNRHKRVYDAVAIAAVVVFVGAFMAITTLTTNDTPDPVVLLMRAIGAAAFTLLHVILCIGPLARLSDRFAPLLYNRRHLGVMVGALAFVHFAIALFWYGLFGQSGTNPVSALLVTGKSFTSLHAFPFELLGFGAFLILALMASTSHDFWLKQLSPGVWKAMHMSVYFAYALLIGHVALGSMRDTQGPIVPILLGLGALTIGGLHAAAGVRETAKDSAGIQPSEELRDDNGDAWVRVCEVDEIPERRARVVCIAGGERIAVFRDDNKVSAVTNVCAHQQGPLGEGKIVNGCITCPWHGYQYNPEDGCSPPPYTEKVATYRVRIEGSDVLLNPEPLPPGTRVEPATMAEPEAETDLFESVTKATIVPPHAARVDTGMNIDPSELPTGPAFDPNNKPKEDA